MKTKTDKKEKKNKKQKLIIAAIAAIIAINALYLTVVYSSSDFISYWRTVWIETAMTTKSHQWLATWLFPQSIIDEVMAGHDDAMDVVGGMDSLVKPEEPEDTTEDDTGHAEAPEDILNQRFLTVGGYDYAGNEIVINDIEEGILVSAIEGPSYKGRIMLVDDPSRVYIGMTKYPGVTGMRILEMMEAYGAVAGVNASGFSDPGDNGNGGEVLGMSLSRGTYWGSYVTFYGSIVLTTDDKLVVGNINNWEEYGNIRDGMQFRPVLIANGEKMIEGSAGYGIQPRTAVGQREDGVMVFLNIDGRDITYSIGCTVGDMADIMLSYGVINASSCDSGATSVIAYKGEVITRNCSLHPDLGRILPNAFLVEPKNRTDSTENN